MLAGRGFKETDREGAPRVAVVNETLARHWWPEAPERAVGHPLKLGGPYLNGDTYDIVGVVGSAAQTGLDKKPEAEVHLAFAQSPSTAAVVMLRTEGDATRLIPTVRRGLAALDPNVAVQSLRPFEEWMGETLTRRRFGTWLLGIFAALAAALSAVGIYGVLNYWVGVRQREIAIRLAVGAQGAEIARWTGWHVFLQVGPGIALGVLGCWGASRWLGSVVFGVSAQDPAVLAAAAFTVMAVASLGASVPVWRATRVDVIEKLRNG